MGGKDIEVELITHGLNIIVSDKKKENEPFSLLQQISEIFSGMKPKAETFAFRHSHLFEFNKGLTVTELRDKSASYLAQISSCHRVELKRAQIPPVFPSASFHNK